jgi:hypothetical protein
MGIIPLLVGVLACIFGIVAFPLYFLCGEKNKNAEVKEISPRRIAGPSFPVRNLTGDEQEKIASIASAALGYATVEEIKINRGEQRDEAEKFRKLVEDIGEHAKTIQGIQGVGTSAREAGSFLQWLYLALWNSSSTENFPGDDTSPRAVALRVRDAFVKPILTEIGSTIGQLRSTTESEEGV